MPGTETSPAGSGRSSFWGDRVPEFLLKRALSLVKDLRAVRISDLRVLVVLWDRAGWPRKSDDGHDAFDGRDGRVSNAALSRATGYVRRTIQLAKRRLEKLGLVWFERDRKANKREIPNRYRILIDLPRDLIKKFLERVRGGAAAAAPADDDAPVEQGHLGKDLGDNAHEGADGGKLRSAGTSPASAAAADEERRDLAGEEERASSSATSAAAADEERRELAGGGDRAGGDVGASSPAEASAEEGRELGAANDDDDGDVAEPERPRTRMWRTLKRALAAEFEARLGVPTKIANQHVPEWGPAMDSALLLAERAVSWGRDEAHVAQRLVHHFYESASDGVRKSGFKPLFLLQDMGAHVAWYAAKYARSVDAPPAEPRARTPAAPRSAPCEWARCGEPSVGPPVDVGDGVIEFRCRPHRHHRELDLEAAATQAREHSGPHPSEDASAIEDADASPCYVCGELTTNQAVVRGARLNACQLHAEELLALVRDRPARPACEGCGRADGQTALIPDAHGFRWLCSTCMGPAAHEHREGDDG